MSTPNPDQLHASITLTTTAASLAALSYILHAATDTLLIQCVGGEARMTLNGNNPTASLGLKIADGAAIQLGLVEARVAKFITATGSPKLEIIGYVK